MQQTKKPKRKKDEKSSAISNCQTILIINDFNGYK